MKTQSGIFLFQHGTVHGLRKRLAEQNAMTCTRTASAQVGEQVGIHSNTRLHGPDIPEEPEPQQLGMNRDRSFSSLCLDVPIGISPNMDDLAIGVDIDQLEAGNLGLPRSCVGGNEHTPIEGMHPAEQRALTIPAGQR